MMKGSQMKTSVEAESLLAGTQPVSAAANEEFASPPQPSGGWDPFEVWRTRIKAAQENPESGVVLG
jgi:hypothetical protein